MFWLFNADRKTKERDNEEWNEKEEDRGRCTKIYIPPEGMEKSL